MQMRAREQRDDEEGINSVELYEGISVLVSFVSDDGDSETREMTQLSGGQKSLVALAIIFSIQVIFRFFLAKKLEKNDLKNVLL